MTQMDLKRVREELEKLVALTVAWEDGTEIPAIERELALGKLRELYDIVRFPHAVEAPQPMLSVQPEIVSEEPLSIDLDDVLSLGLVAEPEPEFTTPVASQSPDILPKPEPEFDEPVADVEPDALSTSAPVASPLSDILPKPKPVVAQEAMPVAQEEPAAVPEPALAPEPEVVSARPVVPETTAPETPANPQTESHPESTATLFELEDDTERHRRKQRVIMSLYGNTEPAAASKPASAAEPKPAVAPMPKPVQAAPAEVESEEDFEEFSVETVRMAPAPATAPVDETFDTEMHAESPDPDSDNDAPLPGAAAHEKEPGTVLGDVIKPNVQTLADTFTPRLDTVSEAAHHAPVRDLRAAIGINDRFLLVRDLFGGDARACDAALDAFNGFESLDDCMIYIAENYAWNPNSDGAKFMMELLERKYA